MTLTVEEKQELIKPYQLHEKDTGSSEVQVAVLTERIRQLTEHLNVHKKDNASKYGLLKLVGRRRRLLKYLRRKHPGRYDSVIARAGLRR